MRLPHLTQGRKAIRARAPQIEQQKVNVAHLAQLREAFVARASGKYFDCPFEFFHDQTQRVEHQRMIVNDKYFHGAPL